MTPLIVLGLLVTSCSVSSFHTGTAAKEEDDGNRTYSMLASTPSNANEGNATVGLVDSVQAQEIYKNAQYISNESFQTQDRYEPQEGLTVLYGSNLDSSTISKFVDFAFEKKVGSQKVLNPTMTSKEELTNTYMVMYLVHENSVDVKYCSVSYSSTVDIGVIENYVSNRLTAFSMKQEIVRFINDEFENDNSALYRLDSDTLIKSESSGVCAIAVDKNTYIDNYSFTTETDSAVIVYEKDINYEARYVPDMLDEYDSYIISAEVNVTPGHMLTSEPGVANDVYGQFIIVRGAKTEFHNLFGTPSGEGGDAFISMSPRNSVTDVNGRDMTCELSYNGTEVSFAFTIDAAASVQVEMNTFFDSDGISYVEFMASDKWRVSENQLYYATAMYMRSVGDVLYTRIATGVTYCFMDRLPPWRRSPDVFAGSGRDLYYEKNGS